MALRLCLCKGKQINNQKTQRLQDEDCGREKRTKNVENEERLDALINFNKQSKIFCLKNHNRRIFHIHLVSKGFP